MQRTLVIEKPKAGIGAMLMFERVTYVSMLSGFVGLVYYLAINCRHAA